MKKCSIGSFKGCNLIINSIFYFSVSVEYQSLSNSFVWETSMKIDSRLLCQKIAIPSTVKWYSPQTGDRKKIPLIYGGKSHYINSTASQLLIKTVFWHRQCTPATLTRKPIALFFKNLVKRLWMGCKNIYTIRLKTLPKYAFPSKLFQTNPLTNQGSWLTAEQIPFLSLPQ